LNCANALASDPVFPLEGYDEASLFSLPTISGRAELQGSLLSFDGKFKDSVTRSQALGMDLIHDLINIRKLAAINVESHDRRNSSNHDSIRYSDKLFQTERRLLTRSNASGPGKFITSCCIAAIIFIDNHLRGIRLNARLIDRLVARLQVSMHSILSGVSIPSLSLNTIRAMVWVRYVGSTVNTVRNRSVTGRFNQALVDFCDTLGLQTWEEIEPIIQSFLWSATWDTHGRIVCNRVEEIRYNRSMMLRGTGEH